MKNFNKSMMFHLVWFLVLIAAVMAIWLFFFWKTSPISGLSALTPLASDTMTVQALTNGNELITNATAHYEVIVPTVWYLEKKAGSGIALYPNYDPAKQVAPACKIEVSYLQNAANIDLDDWLTGHLREDPTADVAESSRMPSTVSGHPAITWTGTVNGVYATLAYISREDGSLYEIAPSVIENGGVGAGASAASRCSTAFQSLMSSFRIMP